MNTVNEALREFSETAKRIAAGENLFENGAKLKFSFDVRIDNNGKVRFVNPSFDEMNFDLAMHIVGALSKAEKEYNEKL